MARTAPCDALGFDFDVAGDDSVLVAHLDEMFRALADARRPSHHYEVLRDGDDCVLRLDGERIAASSTIGRLVSRLVHDVNRRAVDGCDHLLLHAAGLERDGVGYVFPGVSGAGKTTLAAGLVQAGFAYLTDEAVAIDRDDRVVHPYPKPLSLDPGAWPLFPHLERYATVCSDQAKVDQWHVPASAIRSGSIGEPCKPAFVIFPRYEQGATTILEPLGRAHAVYELASCTFRFMDRANESIRQLADLVRGAECWRLTIGDLARGCELVEGLARRTGVVATSARWA